MFVKSRSRMLCIAAIPLLAKGPIVLLGENLALNGPTGTAHPRLIKDQSPRTKVTPST